MEATRCSDMSVGFQQTTLRYIPEDRPLHTISLWEPQILHKIIIMVKPLIHIFSNLVLILKCNCVIYHTHYLLLATPKRYILYNLQRVPYDAWSKPQLLLDVRASLCLWVSWTCGSTQANLHWYQRLSPLPPLSLTSEHLHVNQHFLYTITSKYRFQKMCARGWFTCMAQTFYTYLFRETISRFSEMIVSYSTGSIHFLLSRVRRSMTNNNRFWIGWLDLLTSFTISLVHNKLEHCR
jgi:hypothetical protein